MTTPNGEDGLLYELQIEVEEELTLTETSRPDEATDLPVTDWQFDPADAERERIGLHGLLGAIQAMEDD